MSYGLLLIRVVLGATMSAHGAQKLFGWFGGPGRAGTAGFFAGLELQPARELAFTAALAEFCGGILLALGLGTPFAALAIAAVMVTAVSTVHWKNGFFAVSGGYEFNLLIYAVAVGLAATGPGRFSLDAAAGWADNLSGLWWGLGVLAVSVVAGPAIVQIGRLGARRRLTTLYA
jgi:putative oxidoreductase